MLMRYHSRLRDIIREIDNLTSYPEQLIKEYSEEDGFSVTY